MSYTKVLWQNSPSEATPINADNLNHMDDGIADVDARATTLEGEQTQTELAIQQINDNIGDMSELETEATTLVGAVNEIKGRFDTLGLSVVNGRLCMTYNA